MWCEGPYKSIVDGLRLIPYLIQTDLAKGINYVRHIYTSSISKQFFLQVLL